MSHKLKQEDKRRLERLYEQTRHSLDGGACYDKRKGRLIRYTWNKGTGLTKHLRHCGNHAVRRAGLALHGAQYRRLFGYWWKLY